ncbi:MAG: tRNA lysidine(34) synthetase TilS [Halioglobus sp.]|nr:tRNA lysidine(34) synthetase TilS [Halioglobus sp.]
MSPTLDGAALEHTLGAVSARPHWYLGLSGGVDSSVLLHLLADYRRRHADAPGLSAIHVNHGLQAQAADWQAHCAAVCAALEVPLLAREVQVAGGEAAARTARYAAFEDILGPGEVLFLAHHLDDQVETFFLRLLRGAGVEGLAAMPARRALGAGELLRPLLEVPRDALEAHAARHGLDFIHDPSNDDSAMDRNFLRRQVLPLVASRWPAYRRTVARASAHLAATAQVLREDLGVPPTRRSAAGDPGVALAALAGPSAGAARGLREWLRLRGLQAPDQAALEEFLRQLREGAADSAPRLDTATYTLQRYRDGVYLLPDLPPPPSGPLALAPGDSRAIPGVGRVSLLPAAAGLALPAAAATRLRWRGGGERLALPGRSGRASLKNLLQQRDLPPWWRDRIPLLYDGDTPLALAEIAAPDAAPASGAASARWRFTWQPADDLSRARD